MTLPIVTLKQLRQETGAGIQDCRKAWIQAGEDYTRALAVLQEQAQEAMALRANHQALQGLIEVYAHGNGRIGVMVEVHTETDFAARSASLRAFAHEVALQIAASEPLYLRDEDIPGEVLSRQSDQAMLRARAAGKPEGIIPRIVEGVLQKYKDQHVLMRQAYIRDETVTMAQLLAQVSVSVRENVIIRRFDRWEICDDAEQENS